MMAFMKYHLDNNLHVAEERRTKVCFSAATNISTDELSRVGCLILSW